MPEISRRKPDDLFVYTWFVSYVYLSDAIFYWIYEIVLEIYSFGQISIVNFNVSSTKFNTHAKYSRQFSMGVIFGIRAYRLRSCLGSLEFNRCSGTIEFRIFILNVVSSRAWSTQSTKWQLERMSESWIGPRRNEAYEEDRSRCQNQGQVSVKKYRWTVKLKMKIFPKRKGNVKIKIEYLDIVGQVVERYFACGKWRDSGMFKDWSKTFNGSRC